MVKKNQTLQTSFEPIPKPAEFQIHTGTHALVVAFFSKCVFRSASAFDVDYFLGGVVRAVFGDDEI